MSISTTRTPRLEPGGDGRPTTQLRERDRYIDTLRALALIRVMTYHLFGWAWLPILFPSLGIMFALAGSLIAGSLDRSPGNPWRVLKRRGIRLLPPVWLLGLVLVPVMMVAGWTFSDNGGAPLSWQTLLFWILPISDPPGSELGAGWVVPLWYIRAYLWFLLLSPATLWLFRHWPKRMLAIPVFVVLLSAIGILPMSGRSGDVVLSIAMFGGCWMLGFAHHDHKIRLISLTRVLVGGFSLMALGLAWAFTHQDPVNTYDIDSIPMAETFYCLGAVLILLRLYPDFSWMQRHQVLDKVVTVINSRAITIYLWGNVAIFLSHPLLDLWSVTADADQANAFGYFQSYVMSWLIIIFFVFAFGWCEDLAARRPRRLNPWPRGKKQLRSMRTRKVLTFPRPNWLVDLSPRRLFILTAFLLASATGVSAAALYGTNTPGRTTVADGPSPHALNPRPVTKPPANLGQGNEQRISRTRPTVDRTSGRHVPVATATGSSVNRPAKTRGGHPPTLPNLSAPNSLTPRSTPTAKPTVKLAVKPPRPAPTSLPPPRPTTVPPPRPTTVPPPRPTSVPPPRPTTVPPPRPTTVPPSAPATTIAPPG